jgi:regulator of sigma E protease
VLEAIEGDKIEDPLLVPELLRRRAYLPTDVTVLRSDGDGKRTPVTINVTPREVSEYQSMAGGNEPILVDALGLTFELGDKIAAVTGQAKGKLEPGDVITAFALVPAGDDQATIAKNRKQLTDYGFSSEKIELQDGMVALPLMYSLAQVAPPESKIAITVRRGKQEKTVALSPEADEFYAFPGRGILLSSVERIHVAESWPEAFRLGLRDTGEQLTMVFAFLRKLFTGEIRVTAMGGLPSIFVAGTREASQGPGTLLLFLTMLSANLAVVNFLPIPMLDGGHMMFLMYEGIFRRPVNEAWELRLTLLGLSFLLCLMVFVIGLDISRLSGLL